MVGASILLTLWRNILRQNALVIGLDAHSTNRLLHSNFKLLRVYCDLRLTFLYLQMYLRVHLPCIYVSKNTDIYILLERIRATFNYLFSLILNSHFCKTDIIIPLVTVLGIIHYNIYKALCTTETLISAFWSFARYLADVFTLQVNWASSNQAGKSTIKFFP